tara:strand:- start:947 stop:1339 length:393 start_codon:yes stop_codon:yes gene_type:complete
MARKNGATTARKQAQVSECMKKIAEDNISHKEWCEFATEQYDVSVRWAEKLWQEAWIEIRNKFAVDAETHLQQAVMRLDDLYKKATQEGGDWNTRNNILKEKHKLLGLGKENIEIKSEVALKFDFDNDEE